MEIPYNFYDVMFMLLEYDSGFPQPKKEKEKSLIVVG